MGDRHEGRGRVGGTPCHLDDPGPGSGSHSTGGGTGTGREASRRECVAEDRGSILLPRPF